MLCRLACGLLGYVQVSHPRRVDAFAVQLHQPPQLERQPDCLLEEPYVGESIPCKTFSPFVSYRSSDPDDAGKRIQPGSWLYGNHYGHRDGRLRRSSAGSNDRPHEPSHRAKLSGFHQSGRFIHHCKRRTWSRLRGDGHSRRIRNFRAERALPQRRHDAVTRCEVNHRQCCSICFRVGFERQCDSGYDRFFCRQQFSSANI